MRFFIAGLVIILLTASISFSGIGGDDITFTIKGTAGNAKFSHDSHVSNAGLKCTDCHDSLYVTKEKHKKINMGQMQKGQSCGACHNGKKAFSVKENCNACHQK